MDERWDAEYSKGAHWETGKPSSRMKHFVEYFQKNDLILDAGCGAGNNSLYLASVGFDVTGIDISRVAISKADNEARKRGLNVKFDVGDLNSLSYKDCSFDGIYCGYTLQHTVLAKSVRELWRVLRTDGIAYIVLFQTIIYKDSTQFNVDLDEGVILSTFSKYFRILKGPIVDDYSEVDEHGEHYHKRMVAVLRKK